MIRPGRSSFVRVSRSDEHQSKMFSFNNSRSRLKLKPPKVFLCSLICLVAISTVLLIAQLRAIELGPDPIAEIQRTNLTDIFKQETSHKSFETAAPEVATDQPKTSTTANDRDDWSRPAAETGRQQVSGADQTALNVFANEPAASSASPVLSADGGSLTGSEAAKRLLGLDHDEQLQQAAAQLMVSLAQGQAEPLVAQGQLANLSEPSLAELTAAGAAAGLAMHDLMAQARIAEGLPLSQAGPWPSANERDEVSQEMAANEEPEEGQANQEQEQLVAQQHHQRQQQQEPPSDEDEEANGEAEIPRPRPTQEIERRPLQARPTATRQAAARRRMPAPEPENVQPDPPDENHMPDSIETLMGAELGAEVDEPEEGSPGPTNEQSNVNVDGDPEQQLAGTNLYASNNGNVQAQPQQQQQASADQAQNGLNENDLGDEDESSEDAASNQLQPDQAQRFHNEAASKPRPVLITGNGFAPDGKAPARVNSDRSLGSPMRDSSRDLNAAAGHYYKKKKKKVKKVKKKKIVIKKKKVKKYKVVKIKKKKKKHHHHHGGHHGGHGKYYMYAKVPKKKAWEFGFKKGNKKHWISRHEKGYKNKFKTKVKWYDAKSKGKGMHIWDYNHHDKKKKHY